MDNDLGTMLDGILQDPAQMDRIREIIAGLGIDAASGEATTPAENTDAVAQITPGEEGENLGDMLGGVLRDPAMMARLPGIVSMLRPMMTSEGRADVRPGKRKSRADQRTALLMALRPYLSGGRRDMLDSLINLDRLGGLLMREGRGDGKEKP